ncbi:flotillin domain-containing protein [Mesorhizobium sp. ANAO-SY3R2]|uniref:flotillin family protein n=1 Tax=Mesorhizobium sp. ANAO-SY3R2 TaxID=3166644 RepID=UPI00366D675B
MGVLATTVSIIVAAIVLIAILWVIFWWLYQRATKELAFVRTGLGGQKVVHSGGAFVIPVLHDTIRVNMSTVRLEISRAQKNSIITRDRMRVDVTTEFYVRVGSSPEAIALAAQALGSKTARAEALRDLLEGRFVDVLRTVAAEMTMEELHEHRGDYIGRARKLAGEEIAQIGLELESASLTSFDQTDRQFFNPNNAFDAEGLTRLTTEIEGRRLKRNAIEQDSEIGIQQKNLETETRKLEIAKQEEYARLEQAREIAVRRAEQAASITAEEALRRQQAEEAKVAANLKINIATVQADEKMQLERFSTQEKLEQQNQKTKREIEEAVIETELALKLRRIEREKVIAIEQAEQAATIAREEAERRQAADEVVIAAGKQTDLARLAAEREVEVEKINNETSVEISRHARRKAVSEADLETTLAIDLRSVEQQKTLILGEHQKNIAIAESARAEIQSLAATETEKQTLIKAEEELALMKAREREERAKAVALIQARAEAEKIGITTLMAAEARHQEAIELAKAKTIDTQSEAARLTALAAAETAADKERATAYETRKMIEAKTLAALIGAENSMSDDLIDLKVRLSVIENLKDIIRESAKPMEQIDTIKIVEVNGMLNGSNGGSGQSDLSGDPVRGNLADQVMTSALRYRAQAPVVDTLLREIGLKSPDSDGISGLLAGEFNAGAEAVVSKRSHHHGSTD